MCGKFRQTTFFFAVLFATGTSAPAFATSDRLYMAVQKKFESDYKNVCETINRVEDNGFVEPEIFDMKFNYLYEEEGSAKSELTLFIFPCLVGAYNFASVFYSYEESLDQISQLHFAVPEYQFDYLDDTYETAGEIELSGFSATQFLFNPNFNEETNSIFSISKWRGMADASESGLWKLLDGKFVLQYYDVDATYDYNRNPIRVFGEGQPPASDEVIN